MYKNDGVTRRYSESFKLKILAEPSPCEYSKRQLPRIYGLQSTTINELVGTSEKFNEHTCYGRD